MMSTLQKITPVGHKILASLAIFVFIFILSSSIFASTMDQKQVSEEDIKSIEQQLRFGTTNTQIAAIKKIRDDKIEALYPHLIRLVDKTSPKELLNESIFACRVLEYQDAIPSLVGVLNHVEDNQLQSLIIRTLGYLDATSALISIRPFLNDKDSIIRVAAIESLGRLKDKESNDTLISFANDDVEENYIREASILALGSIGLADNVPILIYFAESESFLKTYRLAAIRSLGNFHTPSVLNSLLELILDEDINIKLAAISSMKAFAQQKSTEAIQLLTKQFHNNDAKVRLAVIDAVATNGDKEYWEYLKYLAENDNDKTVKEKAFSTICQIDNEQSLSYIREILEGKDTSKQSLILNYIHSLPGNAAVEMLCDFFLTEKELTPRRLALSALNKLEDKQLVSTKFISFLQMTESDEDSIKLFNVIVDLQIHRDDSDAFDVLKEAIKHPNESVRGRAIHLISRLEHDQVIPTLLTSFDQEGNSKVQWALIKAVEWLKSTEFIEVLKRNMDRFILPETQREAKRILKDLEKKLGKN